MLQFTRYIRNDSQSQAISTGGDVAIVIASILAVVVSVMGFFLSRKLYRRWKQRRTATITSRELELDFDTTDLETGSFKPMRRSFSDRSDAPLIKGRHELRPSSVASFESDLYTVPMDPHAMTQRTASPEPLPNPYDTPRATTVPPPSAIPIIKQPSPPVHRIVAPSSRTTAEHQLVSQLTTLASRPSFLAKPRTAPRPQTRERTARELRTQLLSRLASTRSSRRSRSVDYADSPSSMYSQASAAPSGLHSSVDVSTLYGSEPVPPIPPLPQQYQNQNFGFENRHQEPRPKPIQPSGSGNVGSSRPLEDSVAFPLPIVDDSLSEPHTLSSQWFKTLWSTASPSSTSASPSHSPEDVTNVPSTAPDVPSLRSLEVQRSQPHYAVSAAGASQQGTVGYQLPQNWRAGQAMMAMPVPQVHDARVTIPRGPRQPVYRT